MKTDFYKNCIQRLPLKRFGYGILIIAACAGISRLGYSQHYEKTDLSRFMPPAMASLSYASSLNDAESMMGASPVRLTPEAERLAAATIPSLASDNRPNKTLPDSSYAISKKQVTPVLSRTDAELYRKVFALQQEENWKQADEMRVGINNHILKGHVLAQRYLSRSYQTSYAELYAWLEKYADLPQADRLHRLATYKRKGKDPRLPALQRRSRLSGYGDDNGLGHKDRLAHIPRTDWHGRDDAYAVWTNVDAKIEAGDLSGAEKKLFSRSSSSKLRSVEFDVARWQIAAHQLFRGNAKGAYRLAHEAAQRSGDAVPQIHWIAGIAAWQLKKIGDATSHFIQMAAERGKLSPWEYTASSFWAYRGLQKMKDARASRYLQMASADPRTFYGVLARRIQGRTLELDGANLPVLDDTGERVLYDIPAVKRSVALKQAGNLLLAEKELRTLFLTQDVPERLQLLALAHGLDLPSTQISMAKMLEYKGYKFDRALYPAPQWEPETGYTVDPSLIFAFARQESGFHPVAKGVKGAMGVMQVMPTTAQMMEKKYAELEDVSDENMFRPQTNVAVGQTYLKHLLENPLVKGNLIYLAAAYNAGPGRLADWKKSVNHQGDSLLFLESMPYGLTRNYVAQVLTSYWIYHELEGKKGRSALALAQGQWPTYDADNTQIVAAVSSHAN